MEISIEYVTKIHLSPIAEYPLDEVEEGEDRCYRTLTIETAAGALAIEISAPSQHDLELVEDV